MRSVKGNSEFNGIVISGGSLKNTSIIVIGIISSLDTNNSTSPTTILDSLGLVVLNTIVLLGSFGYNKNPTDTTAIIAIITINLFIILTHLPVLLHNQN